MEELILKNLSRQMKDEKSIRNSQSVPTPGKSCLTNLVNFYDKMTDFVDERRAVDTVSYLDSRQKLSPIRSS